MWFYNAVMHTKDENGIAKQSRPWSDFSWSGPICLKMFDHYSKCFVDTVLHLIPFSTQESHHSRTNKSCRNYAGIIEPPHDKTNKMACVPTKTKISLSICPVWSASLLCAQWVAKDPSFLHADSEDSDQTGRMPRLIRVFAGRTDHFVGFVMRQLSYA